MVSIQPLLVVLAGRPGTGKSTAAGRLVQELHGAYCVSTQFASPFFDLL